MSTIKVTKNEKSVLQWLLPRVSAIGVIKVSSYEISLNMGWSKPYTRRVLKSLEEKAIIQELQQGTGQRASKYRIFVELTLKGDVGSFSGTQKRASGTQLWTSGLRAYQYVPSDNLFVPMEIPPKNTSKRSLLFIQNKSPSKSPNIAGNDTEYSVFSNAKRVKMPVKTSNTPFRRFRVKYGNPKTWGPTDVVCYYSYLFQCRFGETPVLNWPKECGAAGTLIQRLNEAGAIKTFLQVAFYKYRGKPKSLASFSYSDFYEQCIDAENIEDAVDDFEDAVVLPWAREQARAQAAIDNADYYAKMDDPVRTASFRARKERERKQRAFQRMDDHIAANWYLYSEIGR